MSWWSDDGPAAWLAAILSGIAAWGVVRDWRQKRRDAPPNIDARVTFGAAGRSIYLKITNRLSETLFVDELRSRAQLLERQSEYDPGGGIVRPLPSIEHPSPWRVDWSIPPGQSASFSFLIGDTHSSVTLILSSSLRTLSARKLTLPLKK